MGLGALLAGNKSQSASQVSSRFNGSQNEPEAGPAGNIIEKGDGGFEDELKSEQEKHENGQGGNPALPQPANDFFNFGNNDAPAAKMAELDDDRSFNSIKEIVEDDVAEL